MVTIFWILILKDQWGFVKSFQKYVVKTVGPGSVSLCLHSASDWEHLHSSPEMDMSTDQCVLTGHRVHHA